MKAVGKVALVAVGVLAISIVPAMARGPAAPVRAIAELHGATGADAGRAVAEQTGATIRVTVEVKGLTPGLHGAHIHAIGVCDAPDFKGAGGHWNPGMKQHGMDNPMGMHAGDLPNLKVGADGKAKLVFTVTGASWAQLMDTDGASLVVHAAPDDLKTDPSGNSGARIACGVFKAP